MTTPATNHPRIAIVGGGPSGLVLLLTLHRRGIPATVYERDDAPFARQHLGGILDLGWDSGQLALRENGLQETFDTVARAEAQETRMVDRHGNLLFAVPPDPNRTRETSRPEIDRSKLRKILLDSVPPESIKWGHALASARKLEDGTFELVFVNGTTAVCDILIGADGAKSRVRPLVSPATPIYQGVTGVEVSLPPEVAAREDMRDIVDAVGNGSLWAASSGTMFGAQRNGDGRIRAYLWHHGPLDWKLPTDPAEAKKVLLEMYEGWATWMRKLIANCDETAIYPRPIFYLPAGHSWEHVPGVTLIGDAAHLMSPAGAGANLAMLEGYELGVLLVDAFKGGKSEEEREAAIAAWEKKTLFEKGGKWTAESIQMFGGGFVEMDQQAIAEVAGRWFEDTEARKDA